MRIRVERPFADASGRLREVGEELDVNNNLGADICAKGYGSEVKPKQEGRQPLWQHRIGVSQGRSLTVAVWPPFEDSKFKSPSVVLDEGRKSEQGTWEHSRIYLPGGRLLELAEAIREAWREYRKHGREEEEE